MHVYTQQCKLKAASAKQEIDRNKKKTNTSRSFYDKISLPYSSSHNKADVGCLGCKYGQNNRSKSSASFVTIEFISLNSRSNAIQTGLTNDH